MYVGEIVVGASQAKVSWRYRQDKYYHPFWGEDTAWKSRSKLVKMPWICFADTQWALFQVYISLHSWNHWNLRYFYSLLFDGDSQSKGICIIRSLWPVHNSFLLSVRRTTNHCWHRNTSNEGLWYRERMESWW